MNNPRTLPNPASANDTVLIQLNHIRNPSVTPAPTALGSARRPVPSPILHTDSSGGLRAAGGAGSPCPHSAWDEASPRCLVTAEWHRRLSPPKPGHPPASPVRKPLSPPPKGMSFSKRSRIKWEFASQALCSQPPFLSRLESLSRLPSCYPTDPPAGTRCLHRRHGGQAPAPWQCQVSPLLP